MNIRRFFRLYGAGLILVAALPALAAPIRVGIFAGVGTGRFWHTSTHTASNALLSILARPDTANIGPDLVIHPDGFLVSFLGLTGTATGSPMVVQRQAFIDALDTLDVVILNQNVDIGNIFSATPHRERLEAFSRTKGVISLHQTLDTYGTWAYWDSLQGARFQNHPASDRQATIRLDSIGAQGTDASWWFLNRGLPDTARFVEEWFSFTTNGDVIRSNPGLNVTVDINEATYQAGLGGARAMGDHPMSWYRNFPEGGRFFYTAIGHRAQTYLGTTTSATTPEGAYFLRRQLYNAILWVAGYNWDGTIPVRRGVSGRVSSDAAKVSFAGSTLSVSVLKDGPHVVEVRSLDGRLTQSQRGTGRVVHKLEGLNSGAVYAVSVTSAGQRFARLVTTP
jgi:type 1 glutamine amidotransferase